MRVLVLGGRGFIGRHVVAALRARSIDVDIGSRHKHADETQVLRLRMEGLERECDWQEIIEPYDCVINCVGIMRSRWREPLNRVQYLAPIALAKNCAENRTRLLHISALGLGAHRRSKFLNSKWNAEKEILRQDGPIYVVRPSLLDGEGGFGARWIRRVAQWPVNLIPAQALGRIAALHVNDLADAMCALVLKDARQMADLPRAIELGGTRHFLLPEYLAHLRHARHAREARVIKVPALFARLASHLCDVLHVTPYSFGHLELLMTDNIAEPNHLPGLLGRPLRALGPVQTPVAAPAEKLPALS